MFFILYIKWENGGVVLVCNIGVLLVQGEYIVFFDSDDYWDVDYLNCVVIVLMVYLSLDWLYFVCCC